MLQTFLNQSEISFAIGAVLSLIVGLLIGSERELRGKETGISTHILVVLGAMILTFISVGIEGPAKANIPANVVTGIGFLGAGLIIKGEDKKVKNLTTAASIWFSAAIGIAIGYSYYLIALVGTLICILIPRIPHLRYFLNNKLDKRNRKN